MSRNGASGASDRFKNYDMRVQARSGRPIIDGVLDDGEWAAAMQVGSFIQFRPDPGEAATGSTTAWVLYDEDGLYVGFHCVRGYNVGTASYIGGAWWRARTCRIRSAGGPATSGTWGVDFDLRPSDSFNLSGMVALTSAPGLTRRNAAYHLAANYSSRTLLVRLPLTSRSSAKYPSYA